MNLDIIAGKDEFGGRTSHRFTEAELRALSDDDLEEVRDQIDRLFFLEASGEPSLKAKLGFSMPKRIQTMFLHGDRKLRAMIDGGKQGRREGTWLFHPDVYVEAQTAGLMALQKTAGLSGRVHEEIEHYLFSLTWPNPTRLLVKATFADETISPSVMASYQRAVIEAAAGKAKKVEWTGVEGDRKPIVIMAVDTPHFREVNGDDPRFPEQDGIEVLDLWPKFKTSNDA